MKILLAEDEPKVRKFVGEALRQAGMVVDEVEDYLSLLTAAQTYSYDVLVLDRMLAGKDILEGLEKFREKSPQAAILILSALSEVQDRVKGLGEGADDYLGKPFHVTELIARVRALGRRKEQGQAGQKANRLEIGDLKVDLQTQKVFLSEKRIDLSGKEFRLLCLLMRHPGQVFSKSELLDQVWEMQEFPESNVVEVTVANLRNKLGKSGYPTILSKRGAGYWLEVGENSQE